MMETTVYQSNIRKKYMSVELLISSILNNNDSVNMKPKTMPNYVDNYKVMIVRYAIFPYRDCQ